MSVEEGSAPIVVGEKPMKRFNNGHKTFTAQEAKFLSEIYTGEKKSQGKFAESVYELRRPRNTVLGEATPRPGLNTTEKYFPENKLHSTSVYSEHSMTRGSREDDPLYKEFKTKIELVDSLSRQKNKIEEELRVVNQVLAHKKLVLSMSSGTMGQINSFPQPLPK